MKKKSHILIFIDWFYPAYKAGGPVKSVFNLVQVLQKEYQFSIVTSNCDIDGEELAVPTNEWTTFQEIPIIYLSTEQQKETVYRQIFSEINPDFIYYNSLFSKEFTLTPYQLFKKKTVKQIIAPRGMLGKGALSIKPLKKKAFLKVAKLLLFEKNNTYWHATSAEESEEIKMAFGNKAKVKVAQNLSSTIVKRGTVEKKVCKLKLVFLSRLAEKKNLLFVLELLSQIKEVEGISMDIYGPIEEKKYWEKCNILIEKDKRINYKGVLAPHEIAPTLQQYHFYILPTLHENYGHSIVEALVAGVPIIISENTPWRNLKVKGIGADISLEDLELWKDYLNKMLGIDQTEYEKMVERCFVYAKENIVNAEHVVASRLLFE